MGLLGCEGSRPVHVSPLAWALGVAPVLRYSFPLSIVLNTTACLAGPVYTDNLVPIGIAMAVCAVALFIANKDDVQSPAIWAAALATP